MLIPAELEIWNISTVAVEPEQTPGVEETCTVSVDDSGVFPLGTLAALIAVGEKDAELTATVAVTVPVPPCWLYPV